jgi:hypothetical protein
MEQVISDVVIFPIDRIMAGVGTRVTPVTAEVVLLVGGTGTAQGEQLARHLSRYVSAGTVMPGSPLWSSTAQLGPRHLPGPVPLNRHGRN